MNKQDKIKILFPSPKDVFKMFHIDFNTGYIYLKRFWDQNIQKRTGRPTADNLYQRVSVTCQHLDHIFKRGYTDVLAHRLIYYAYTGELPEKVDHRRKDGEYLDAISNLATSDAIHNRWNTKKVNKRISPPEQRVDNSPSSYRERKLKEYKGIYFAYGYYWALFANKILNENGFVHKDIKCNNIMIDFDGNPKLIDFGMAENVRNNSYKGYDSLMFLVNCCIDDVELNFSQNLAKKYYRMLDRLIEEIKRRIKHNIVEEENREKIDKLFAEIAE